MRPSLAIPTDNIYKFSCLFGLALIISSIFALVSLYTSSLEKKIKYSETIVFLEAKAERSKVDNDLLAMNKRLVELTKNNEDFAGGLIIISLVVGIVLSWAGAQMWYPKQVRDDKFESLQLTKLELEIAKLRSELSNAEPSDPT